MLTTIHFSNVSFTVLVNSFNAIPLDETGLDSVVESPSLISAFEAI